MSQTLRGFNKIRILHLIKGLGIGGAEILLFNLIKGLGDEAYEHHVYCFGNDGPLRERLSSLGASIHLGKQRASAKDPLRFVLTLSLLVKDLLSFIKINNIKIIQSHLLPANELAIVVGKLAGIPVFPTVHSPKTFVDERSWLDPRVHMIKALDKIAYRFAERVLVVSEEIREVVQCIYRISNSKISLLRNGIVFDDGFIPKVYFEKEFPHSDGKLKIIAVGRLAPSKSFDTLIRSIPIVIEKGLKNLLVLIVGRGEERQNLEQLIEDLGIGNSVHLLGLRHDVIDLLTASDLFVMPSRYEGLSMAMIEAMACGLPIIASDIRGLKDYITDGENGLLFSVDNHVSLSASILKLGSNDKLRARLSNGARQSFERKYDMRKNIKPLEVMFKEAAGYL
jgi:glycosyltransferase involved in cell wall biosynthesis